MDKILENPFFKKEHDQSNLKTITELEQQLNQADIDLKKATSNVVRYEEEIQELGGNIKDMDKDQRNIKEELRKLTAFNDPSGLSVE